MIEGQTAASPEDILIAYQDAEQLDRALDRVLTPRVNLAVRLYYGLRCEPHRYKHVAQRYGVSVPAVRRLVTRAERRLAAALQDAFPERYAVMEERRRQIFGEEPWPMDWKDKVRDHAYRQLQKLDMQRRGEERGRWIDEQTALRDAQHDAHIAAWHQHWVHVVSVALQQRAEALYQNKSA